MIGVDNIPESVVKVEASAKSGIRRLVMVSSGLFVAAVIAACVWASRNSETARAMWNAARGQR